MTHALIVVSLAVASLGAVTAPAAAHDFAPGVLVLAESEPGVFRVDWTEPVDAARPLDVSVRFPEQCEERGQRLQCGGAGLRGEIAFPGLTDPRVRVVVLVRRLGGESFEAVAHGGEPRVSLDERPRSSLGAWVRIGAEHVVFGPDHLAFVMGLLLVVGLRRGPLIATITAFTVGHSVTLALATFGLLRLASAPVEATIAASVLLVAREATHDEPTVTRRLPWIVAGLFGLVHGLGFAGALADLGLPRGAEGWALLGFNLGVEAGQLAVVALVAGLILAARRASLPVGRGRLAACYALGALGGWWAIDRTVAVITGSS